MGFISSGVEQVNMDRRETIAQLEEAIHQAKNHLIRKKAERDLLKGNVQQLNEKAQKLILERDLLDKVRILFQLSSDHARAQAKTQLETLVTNALQYVFGSAFRFEIELSDHGGNPTAEFYVVSQWDDQEIKNKPQDARGGGIVDVISLALRIALIETIKPKLDGPILLDEPGKHVSEDYIVPLIEFIKSVGETFGRQIILVTHNQHLTESANRAYHVRLMGGKSHVVVC